jgi:hypothetical protein
VSAFSFLKLKSMNQKTKNFIKRLKNLNAYFISEKAGSIVTEELLKKAFANHMLEEHQREQREKISKADVLPYCSAYIISLENLIEPSVLDGYEYARQMLVEFLGDDGTLPFEVINKKFLWNLCLWLKVAKESKPETIIAYLQFYRDVIKYMLEEYEIRGIPAQSVLLQHFILKTVPFFF